ncbi:hypothetical protein TNCV_3754481, partial [Trichonephila clavipes]
KCDLPKSRTVAGGRGRVAQKCVVRACPKHARLDSGQESTLAIPSAAYCFCFKHVSPPDERALCRRRHYHPENSRISNGSSVRDDMVVEVSRSALHSARRKCHPRMKWACGPCVHSMLIMHPILILNHSLSLYCDLLTNELRSFRVPRPSPYTRNNASGVTI